MLNALGVGPEPVQDGVLVAEGVLAVHCQAHFAVLARKVLDRRFLHPMQEGSSRQVRLVDFRDQTGMCNASDACYR